MATRNTVPGSPRPTGPIGSEEFWAESGSKEALNEAIGFRFSVTRFVGLVIVVALILFCRRPEGLLLPQFFAEDGAVFFKDAYELPWWASVTKTFAGYFHAVPRLVAEAGLWFPLEQVPLIYNLAALAIAAVAVSWIWLPHFRQLIPDDGARLAVVMLFACSSNQEALMKISYVQWYLLLWLMLCEWMEPVRHRLAAICLAIASVLAVWTAPLSVVLLPLWGLRIFRSGRSQKQPAWLLVVSCLMMLAAVKLIPAGTDRSPGVAALSWLSVLHGLANGIVYKVVCTAVCGHGLTNILYAAGQWWVLYGIACGIMAGMLALLIVTQGHQWRVALAAAYVGVGSVGLFLLRPEYVHDFITGEGVTVHDRYFYVPMTLFLLVLAMLATSAVSRVGNARNRAIVSSGMGLAWLALQVPWMQMRWTPEDLDWHRRARQIEAVQLQADAMGEDYTGMIPLNPYPWHIELNICPRK